MEEKVSNVISCINILSQTANIGGVRVRSCFGLKCCVNIMLHNLLEEENTSWWLYDI